jgi:23S rRNA pseudouridine1911/1915/1917 synthase
MKNFFTIAWDVQDDERHLLLREYLKKKKISRAALTDIKFHGGALFVNGKEATVRKRLNAGDEVTVCFPPEKQSDSMEAENIPIEAFYEDDHFLLINKPAGMPTIPSLYQPTGSLAQAVLYYYKVKQIPATFHAVNRLDKDTSGVVLVAKHRFAHSLMSQQQKEKTIKREYIAFVQGDLRMDKGTIDAAIGRNPESIIERMVRDDGQRSITHFEKVSYVQQHDFSVVRLRLETGRTHQIRVHMSSIGHPLLGDDLYGGNERLIKRQALHSVSTSFIHPFTTEFIQISVPFPADMKRIWNQEKQVE